MTNPELQTSFHFIQDGLRLPTCWLRGLKAADRGSAQRRGGGADGSHVGLIETATASSDDNPPPLPNAGVKLVVDRPASVEELDIRAPFHQVFYFWEYYQDTGGSWGGKRFNQMEGE